MKNSFSKVLYPILYTIIFVLSFSCSNDSLETEEESEIANNSVENQILMLVNEHRSSIGKQSLKLNDLANSLAKDHTLHMIDKNAISHDNFNQRSQKLITNEKANSVGENVAAGQKSAQTVMNAWLNSSGHRENIEGDFTHIGISAVKNKSGTYYFTQLFLKK